MKFSFTTLTTPDYTVQQIVETAKLYGYDGVDLRASYNRGQLTVESSVSEIKSIRNSFINEGIIIPSLLCYFETCVNPGTATQEFEDWLRRHIEIGEMVGAQALRLFTHPSTNNIDREVYLNAYAETLNKVISKEKTSIQVYIQNHEGYSTAEEVLSIVDKAKHPNVHMVYSPDHCLITGENVGHIYGKIIRNSKQLYISDIMRQNGGFISVLPGKGILPIGQIHQDFLQQGFEGFTTFKWYKLYQPELANPNDALPYFINYMKSL